MGGRPKPSGYYFYRQAKKQATGEWYCPYRILGAGRDLNFGVCGVDSMQALELVFGVIDATLAGDDLRLLAWGEPSVKLDNIGSVLKSSLV